MHTPSREAFGALAAGCNVIPVYREIVADDLTPVGAYAALARGGGEPYRFLLESVLGGAQWANYSFLGVSPRAVLRVQGNRARSMWRDIEGGGATTHREWEVTDPTAALEELMRDLRPAEVPGLPRFWGGAVGFVGYDCVRSFEALPSRAAADVELPELCFLLTDVLLVFDHFRQVVKVVATPYVADPRRADEAYDAALARIDAVIAQLAVRSPLRPLQAPVQGGGEPAWESSFSRSAFLAAVERCKEYIRAGDAFQIVLSQRLEVARGDVGVFDVYRGLRLINPSPYMYLLELPEVTVAGASPETLVRLEGSEVTVRPIAGTRRRTGIAHQDAASAQELLTDPKERAEHLMLVDLGRNDVGRVCRPGSVRVVDLMHVEQYSHVMHIVSKVQGTLQEGLAWRDVLHAAFPAGTLSGAPKIRAMEIIDELEPHRRGIFGGAVGYVSYTGNMDVAIAIRTLVATRDRFYVQAGAGVVADSDPQSEYEETLNKARAVLGALHLAATS